MWTSCAERLNCSSVLVQASLSCTPTPYTYPVIQTAASPLCQHLTDRNLQPEILSLQLWIGSRFILGTQVCRFHGLVQKWPLHCSCTKTTKDKLKITGRDFKTALLCGSEVRGSHPRHQNVPEMLSREEQIGEIFYDIGRQKGHKKVQNFAFLWYLCLKCGFGYLIDICIYLNVFKLFHFCRKLHLCHSKLL